MIHNFHNQTVIRRIYSDCSFTEESRREQLLGFRKVLCRGGHVRFFYEDNALEKGRIPLKLKKPQVPSSTSMKLTVSGEN